jgi:hypothetical protein
MPWEKSGTNRVRFAGVALAMTVVFSGSAYAADCLGARERDSQVVRALQSRLMVAAFSCNARADYNQFVLRYRPHLAFHGRELQQYFRKQHRQQSTRALNSFVTSLANGASQISITNRAGFCEESRVAFSELKIAQRHEAPLVLQAVAHESDWRFNPAKVCEALVQVPQEVQ